MSGDNAGAVVSSRHQLLAGSFGSAFHHGKRVLFLVSSMQGGGAERVAALLCNRWAEQGHDVLLVPTFSGRGKCHYSLDEKVRLEYLADRVGTARKSPLSTLRRFLAIRSLVKEFHPNAVVAFLTHVNVATLLATRGLDVPVVVSERIYPPAMPTGAAWSLLRRHTYPWAQTVVMQTSHGLEWLHQEIPSARGEVIPNPCVLPLPESEPRISPSTVVTEGRRILLAAGRLEDQKGFTQLIEAFERLAGQFQDWDLAILGEGKQRTALEARIAAAGLDDRVHLPGRAGNLADWYARAELYAMSSRFEGFPNTLLEAMAHGLPAVSFDCPTGPADLIEDGRNGYLIPVVAGPKGLADKLGRLIADDAARQSMSQRAAEVRKRFSMAQVATAWDQTLGLET